DKLFNTIDSQHISSLLVIKCPDGACAASNLFCCKVEVLAGVARIDMHQPPGSLGIAPGHPVYNTGPEECHGRIPHKCLPQARSHNPVSNAKVCVNFEQPVGECEIPVEP